MAVWNEPKNNYTIGDEVTPGIFNELAENERYLKETQDTKIILSDVKNATINNTQSASRVNLIDNEQLSAGFGKIRKWFSDLKALAFKDTVSDSDIISVSAAKVTGLHTVATSGSYNDLTNKPEISKQAVGLSNVANERQYSSIYPPPYPVTSVNGLTGAVTIPPSEVAAGGTYPNMTVGNSINLNGKDSTEYVQKIAGEKILRRKDLFTGTVNTDGNLADIFTSPEDLLNKDMEIVFSANGIFTSTSSTGGTIRSAFAGTKNTLRGRFITGCTMFRMQLYSHANDYQSFADIYFTYNSTTKKIQAGTVATTINHNGAYADGGALIRVYTGRVNALTIYRISIFTEE
jgi:hypothetical protein